MKIETQCNGGCLIVRLEGELDMATVSKFRKNVVSLIETKQLKYLLLNLTKVTFIDSTGLGAILGRYRVLANKGGGIFLVGLKPQVKRIFALAGMLKIMPECNSEEEVMEKISNQGEFNFA